MAKRQFFLLVVGIIAHEYVTGSKDFMHKSAEHRLIHKLLSNEFLKDVRPTLNYSEAVTVTIGITLSQLVTLDAKNQILTTNTWIRQVWYNPYLTWNKTEYEGIIRVNVNPQSIWLPDITLYNNAEGDNDFGGSMDKLSTRVILHHTGKCVWLSPAMVQSKCNIDIRDFPFDTQQCELKLGSWTFNGNQLDLQTEGPLADLSKYTDNAEWKLINMTANRNVVKYICCTETYPDITFTITMKRRSLFYLINLLIPLVMISGLACMTFLVPFESGERVSLSITVLLSMTVFMLLVQGMIPPTSNSVPLVAKFYTAAMMEMGIGVVIACYNLHLYFIDPQFYKMPNWMKKFVLGRLSNWVGVKTNEERCQAITTLSKANDSQTRLASSSTSTMRYLEEIMDYGIESENYHWEYEDDVIEFPENPPNRILRRQSSVDSTKLRHIDTFKNDILNEDCSGKLYERRESFAKRRARTVSQEEFVSLVKSQHMAKLAEQKIQDDKQEWREAAMTFDKLCFYIFTLMFVITFVWVFAEAPGYVS